MEANGPIYIPNVATGLIIFLCAIDLVGQVSQRKKAEALNAENAVTFGGLQLKAIAGVCLILGSFSVGLPYPGYPIAAMLLVFGSMIVLGERQWGRSFFIATLVMGLHCSVM